jgi:3-oxoacyl-[acyl-carrier-protein] synthase-3
LRRGASRPDDYRALLLNHRQQVIEGSRWIALAASSITNEYAELRAPFYAHALAEHRDYLMIEQDYVSIGGDVADIRNFPKNVGSKALHGYMYAHATKTNRSFARRDVCHRGRRKP